MEGVEVLLSPEEKAVFRRAAEQQGLSLSAWLRQAGLDRLAASSAPRRFAGGDEVQAFFARLDEGEGREPDWEAHLDTMRRSRKGGASGP
jgi:hypothetical protein